MMFWDQQGFRFCRLTSRPYFSTFAFFGDNNIPFLMWPIRSPEFATHWKYLGHDQMMGRALQPFAGKCWWTSGHRWMMHEWLFLRTQLKHYLIRCQDEYRYCKLYKPVHTPSTDLFWTPCTYNSVMVIIPTVLPNKSICENHKVNTTLSTVCVHI